MLASPYVVLAVVAASLAGTAGQAAEAVASPVGKWVLTLGMGDSMRHCSFQLFAVNGVTGPAADYLWNVVPALNKHPGAVSFESTNYPGKYVIPITNAEADRLGIGAPADPDDASFTFTAVEAANSTFTFQHMAAATKGLYLAGNGQMQGSCHYGQPSTDLALVKNPSKIGCTFAYELHNTARGCPLHVTLLHLASRTPLYGPSSAAPALGCISHSHW